MKQKNLLFTFDYELFLGSNSGSVQKCMIKPTEILLQSLNAYGIKGIFFVDSTYLVELEKKAQDYEKAKTDFNLIKNQLNDMILNGHYVYPHLHPHWMDATYNEASNSWSLENASNYRFESLNNEQRRLVFKSSFDCLRGMVKESNPNYRMQAYRAGGWCIQPFETFKPYFTEYGIDSDFSVLPGVSRNSNILRFDFSKIESTAFPYPFDNEVTDEVATGAFMEFPITSIPKSKTSVLNKIIKKVLWRIPHGENYGNGNGQNLNKPNGEPFDGEVEMASLELFTIDKLPTYLKLLKKNDYFQFICHPKMISRHHIFVLNIYLKTISKRYKIESDWLVLKQFYSKST